MTVVLKVRRHALRDLTRGEYTVRSNQGCTLIALVQDDSRVYHCEQLAKPCPGCVYNMPNDFVTAVELAFSTMMDNLWFEVEKACDP